MKAFVIPALLGLLTATASAVTITIDAELLKDANGTAMPTSGLVILTAGTQGEFNGPRDGQFAYGNEFIVTKWDLSSFITAGVISDIAVSLPFTADASGQWGEGDPLRLYWYPTLTLSSTEPVENTSFGTYRDPATVAANTLDGSGLWITPGESDTISLKFFSSDASLLNIGGSNSAATGNANLLVPASPGNIPEPGSTLLLSGVAALLLARRRK